MRRGPHGWLFAASLVMTACPSSSVPVESFLERYRAARCENGLRCAATAADSSCHPDASERFAFARTHDPHVLYDGERAARFLESLATRCGDDAYEECELVFQGALPAGAACSFWLQCEPGTFCSNEDEGLCGGTCTPLLGEGVTCEAGEQLGCAEGLRCSSVCSGCPRTCNRAPGPGEPCDERFSCAPGLWCDAVADECYPRDEAAGRPCDSRCPPEFVCGVSNVCEPYDGSRLHPGDPCTPEDDCPRDFTCFEGVCTAFASVGEACEETLPCHRGVCDEGRCRAALLGEPCVVDGDCSEGFCRDVDRLCAAPSAPGSPCHDPGECGPAPAGCLGGSCEPDMFSPCE